MQRILGTDIADPSTRDVLDASADETRTLGSWVLATWVGVAMVVVLPALLVYLTPAPKDSVWLFALAVTTIAGARYAWIVAEGRRRLYEVSFWVFTYVFVGIAPLVQLRTGETPDTTPDIDTTLQFDAMMMVIVGVIAFAIGLWICGSGAISDSRNFLRGAYVVTGVDLRRTILLAMFALLIDTYFIAKVGIATLFSSRVELGVVVNSIWVESSISALVSGVVTMTLLVSFIALVKCIKQTKSREWPLIALTVLVGLALMVTVNPIVSPRYIFGTVALSVAAVFGLFATPRLFRLTAILWVIALIVVFPFADAFRSSSQPSFKSSSTIESMTSPDFDAVAQINNTLLYVEKHGVTAGRQAMGAALTWVPRRLWPDKPRDTGILLAESRGYNFTNLSGPVWAEMYINGGWPLLVLGMAGLGVLVRSQDTRIEESFRRARAPSIFALILPFYLTILLRGSLLQATSHLLVIVGGAIFVSRWERVSSR